MTRVASMLIVLIWMWLHISTCSGIQVHFRVIWQLSGETKTNLYKFSLPMVDDSFNVEELQKAATHTLRSYIEKTYTVVPTTYVEEYKATLEVGLCKRVGDIATGKRIALGGTAASKPSEAGIKDGNTLWTKYEISFIESKYEHLGGSVVEKDEGGEFGLEIDMAHMEYGGRYVLDELDELNQVEQELNTELKNENKLLRQRLRRKDSVIRQQRNRLDSRYN